MIEIVCMLPIVIILKTPESLFVLIIGYAKEPKASSGFKTT